MTDSVLRHCADIKKRGLLMLPNVGHQIVHIKIDGITTSSGDRDGTVVKALCCKSEGSWFDSRWCHWNFSLT